MRMSLAAVADDGNGLVIEVCEVSVAFVVHLSHVEFILQIKCNLLRHKPCCKKKLAESISGYEHADSNRHHSSCYRDSCFIAITCAFSIAMVPVRTVSWMP